MENKVVLGHQAEQGLTFMSNIDHKEDLRRTIHLLGVAVDMPKVLLHGRNGREIKAVHRKTNDLIQECLKANTLGECIHVTGEMRALTDPFHRYLCEEINHSDQRVFRVIFNLPEEYMQNTTKILEWNLEGWVRDSSERKWYEELRTIYSIANRSVNLYAFDTSNEVQYSVFGNRYTLLQEKHACRTSDKHTWLVESEDMNSLLTARANELIKKATDVDEGNYRRFTQNLNGIASRRFLSLLSAAHRLPIERLITDSIANDFTESTQEILDCLMLMGFIEIHKRELVAITNAGREFVDDR